MPGCITAVPGVTAGHATDRRGVTGCTVVLVPEGAVAAAEVRGSAPGTRETDLLRPGNLVERVHAVLLTGGSAFGLDAAAGVMAYLEEHGYGFDVGVARVPIVPAAVLFDLAVGDPRARPGPAMGYEACSNASKEPLAQGRVGAATGATVAKRAGPAHAAPGGLGCAAARLGCGAWVGVLATVNAYGDIYHPHTGAMVAGVPAGLESRPGLAGANTTLVVVATDAGLTRVQARKVAEMAHDGMARAIRPAHTMYDGDTVFALATGGTIADVTEVGALAADLVGEAIVRAVEMGGKAP